MAAGRCAAPALHRPARRQRHALQRLKTKAQFQAALAGSPVAKTPHFALHRAPWDAQSNGVRLFPHADVWLGMLVPKRWAKRAVTRNTIRRQVVEVTRVCASTMPAAAWVVRLRADFSRKQFISATSEPLKRAVRQELLTLLGRVSVPAAASGGSSHVA